MNSPNRSPSTGLPCGLVLAGGAGRRLGGQKALRRIDGRTWVERAAGLLQPLSQEVRVAVRSAEQRVGAPGCRLQIDPPPGGEGPLPAIACALAESPHGLWVLACDYLKLRGETLARLCAGRGESDDDAAAVRLYRDGAGRLHPLAALWQRSALATIERRLAAGERSVLRALEDLPLAILSPADLPELDLDAELLNVNRPEDLPKG